MVNAVQEVTTTPDAPVVRSVPAVEVADLRKEFWRKDGRERGFLGASRSPRRR